MLKQCSQPWLIIRVAWEFINLRRLRSYPKSGKYLRDGTQVVAEAWSQFLEADIFITENEVLLCFL